jgi:iron complex outermembrane receptor protein
VDFTTENQIVRLIPQLTGGKYQFRKLNTTVQNYQALLNYDKGFMGDDLRLFAYGGWSYRQVNEVDMFAGTGENGLRFPGWYSIGNDMNGTDLNKVRGVARGSDLVYGILGSVTLSWKSKLYLQMDARNDWNSTLPPGNNSYFYPGASIVYNFSNDMNIPQLKNGKFNVSWADIGGGPNVALQNRYFADDSYTVGPVYEGATLIGVMPPDALFLGQIKPFRKREFEVGLNTEWFNQSRLNFEIAFYTNNIYNQIMPLNINPASGWSKLHINTGNVKNWGYEIAIKATPLVSQLFRWNITFTAARQQSKVMELYEGIKEQYIDGIGNAVKVVGTIGQPHGDIYMYDYLRDPSGNKIVNQNGYAIDNTKYVNVGNINPKVFGGLYSDFMIKGFNFHVGIDYKYGGKVFSYSNQYLIGNGVIKSTLPFRDEANGGLAYYIEQGTNRKVPWQHNQAAPANAVGGVVYHDGMILDGVKEVTSGGTTKYEKNDIIMAAPVYYQSYLSDNNASWPPDRMFKNDYIKLREIAIDYTIPKKISDRLKLQRLSINIAARNLGYIYRSIPNIDPESTLGAQGFVENSFYPSIRSFNFGVNLSF